MTLKCFQFFHVKVWILNFEYLFLIFLLLLPVKNSNKYLFNIQHSSYQNLWDVPSLIDLSLASNISTCPVNGVNLVNLSLKLAMCSWTVFKLSWRSATLSTAASTCALEFTFKFSACFNFEVKSSISIECLSIMWIDLASSPWTNSKCSSTPAKSRNRFWIIRNHWCYYYN